MAANPPAEAEAKIQREIQKEAFAEELQNIKLPSKASDPLTGEGFGSLMEAIVLGRQQVQIVNISNNGAAPNLPAYANLELGAVTDSCWVPEGFTLETLRCH